MKEILELKIIDSEWTIKRFFEELLLELWKEGECFSGKHPFGNSGWEYDLYIPLIKAGVIEGEWDEEYQELGDFDRKAADKLITELIKEVFK